MTLYLLYFSLGTRTFCVELIFIVRVFSFYIFTDGSKALLMLWLYLFYVLESKFVLFEIYVLFYSFI